MKIEISYDRNKSLLSAIIFLIVGVILLTNADIVLSFISVVIGSILLITGVIKTFLVYQNKKKAGYFDKSKLIKAVIFLIFGIIFIFFSGIIETSIRFIFGSWILFSGINQLINALSLTKNNNKFLSSLIISILLIILSVYVIFRENLLLNGVGIVMIIYSIIEITGFVFSKKGMKSEESKEGDVALIIPDKNKVKKIENKKAD